MLKAHDSTKNNVKESNIVFSSDLMGGIGPSLLYDTGILANEIQSIKMMVYYSTKYKAVMNSADFMTHNVNTPFFFYQNSLTKITKHFLDGENNIFRFDNHKRKVFDFDTPDLYIFNQTAQVPSLKAKMTFDTIAILAILPFMQKIGFFKILSFREKKWIFDGSGKGDISSFEIRYTNDA